MAADDPLIELPIYPGMDRPHPVAARGSGIRDRRVMTTTEHSKRLKTLGLRSAVLFGLAYMTPIIVLGIFGVIAKASDGASAGAYTLATVAMLFTALSYGVMARHFPVAGSGYT